MLYSASDDPDSLYAVTWIVYQVCGCSPSIRTSESSPWILGYADDDTATIVFAVIAVHIMSCCCLYLTVIPVIGHPALCHDLRSNWILVEFMNETSESFSGAIGTVFRGEKRKNRWEISCGKYQNRISRQKVRRRKPTISEEARHKQSH